MKMLTTPKHAETIDATDLRFIARAKRQGVHYDVSLSEREGLFVIRHGNNDQYRTSTNCNAEGLLVSPDPALIALGHVLSIANHFYGRTFAFPSDPA